MNERLLLVFDGLLLISIVSLAWAALAGSDERRSVILFMAFGLVLAVAWARLLAPDVALAEAAIGAGLSGALLLTAVPAQSTRQRSEAPTGVATRWTVTLLCAALAGTLAWALAHALNEAAEGALRLAVFANLETSGVSNPVTAVLLNFRAYDTLLELAVLLTAVLGIFALGPASAGYRNAGPVFDGLARWLVPLLILTAGYLLWVGAHAPGGAFQAGATLAAAGVVLRLAGRQQIGLPAGASLRILMVAGVGVFLLVGVILLLAGRSFLDYPPALAGALILLIESAAMLAIAATLVLAFVGGRPRQGAVRMLTAQWLYALTGCVLVALGLRTALLDASLLKRVIAINVTGAGVFMVLIAVAFRGPDLPPDPVPHALALTGIVVAVSATALALALARRLDEAQSDD